MRIQYVIHLVGQLLLILAAIMIIPFFYSLCCESPYYSFLVSAVITASLGGTLYALGKESTGFSLRDGFLVVSMTWVLSAFLAAIPFYGAGVLPTYIDALFESVSGITATGASVVPDVDALPRSFALWRALTHWLGGMGIIVLLLAFLKNLGADSAHFFNAEASVPRPGVILPRIRSMASKLWKIYLLFTLVCCLLLWIAGMTFFDALTVAFSTVSTGGFTPNQMGIFAQADNTLVILTLIVFMILAGGNFTVYHEATIKGWRAIWGDFEYRMYLYVLGIGALLVGISLWFQEELPFLQGAKEASFMLVSMQTGSGFAISYYDVWPQMAQMVLFISCFIGGCSGSTTGGIKIIRFILLLKNSAIYLRKAVHPDMVQTIKVNGKSMPAKWVQMAEQYFFLYMLIFAISAIGIAATGIPVGESIQCVAGILGNVGLAFGQLGPNGSFAILHPAAKVICVIDMLLGRLELFTLLVLLRTDFWQGYFVRRRNKPRMVRGERFRWER